MAPPPAKKVKTEPKKPIIVKSPGFKPDIYLKGVRPGVPCYFLGLEADLGLFSKISRP